MYSDYYLNKIIIITGSGSGIGRALCVKLVEAGAMVICTDVDTEKAAETVSLCKQGQAIAKKLDVTQLAEFESLIAETVNEHGRIDLIFNNAGIAVSGEMRDIPIDQWRKIIDINFMGVLYGSQTAYHYMLKQGSGQIVNIASGAGLVDYLALMAPYSVTKHAVVNYTKLLRLEAKALGIKANVVCPGFISTSIGINAIAPNAKPSWSDDAIKMVSKGIGPEKAVDLILKGVARNKEVIIFPYELKVVLFLSRLFKGLTRLSMQKLVKDFRTKHRIND